MTDSPLHRSGITMRRIAVALALVSLGSVMAGCDRSVTDPSSQYFSSTRLVARPPALVGDANGILTAPPPARGPVSRPDPHLTPGVVAVADVDTVCRQPKRARDPIPYATQQAIFTRYKVRYPQDARKYGLDYLVPPQLGGAPVAANIWPATMRGVGFHEKEKLNSRLRLLVCQGQLQLAVVQRQLMTDWYELWIQYGS